MQNKKDKTNLGFDLLSPFYDALVHAFFGLQLERCQVHNLSDVRSNKCLIIGGGSGKILTQIIEKDCFNDITYLDSSMKMILQAQKRIAGSKNHNIKVEFICDSILTYQLNRKYDTIITPFLLDCFTEIQVQTIIQRLKKVMTGRSIFIIADFNIPRRSWMQQLVTSCLWILYLFFHFVIGISGSNLPNFRTIMQDAGFLLYEEQTFMNGMLVNLKYRLNQNDID